MLEPVRDAEVLGATGFSNPLVGGLRVLVSTSTFLPLVGGAELGIHEIYKRLAVANDVRIMTRRMSAREEAHSSEDDFAATYGVYHFRARFTEFGPTIVRRLWAAVGLDYLRSAISITREWTPDVVNLQFTRPHAILIPYFRLRGIPVVLSLVGRSDVVKSVGKLERLYNALALTLASEVTQNSGFYTHGSRWAVEAKTIPYGVDANRYHGGSCPDMRVSLGLSRDDVVFIAVQRLDRVKRVDKLIIAFERLAARHPDVHLLVVGRGPMLDEVNDLSARSKSRRVNILGYVDEEELPRYLRASDVFVSNSAYETFGVSLVQAMACGLAIVAPQSSSHPFVVTPDVGLLFKDGAEDALVAAMEHYYVHPTLRQEHGRAGLVKARSHYDWDTIAETYQDLFESI